MACGSIFCHNLLYIKLPPLRTTACLFCNTTYLWRRAALCLLCKLLCDIGDKHVDIAAGWWRKHRRDIPGRGTKAFSPPTTTTCQSHRRKACHSSSAALLPACLSSDAFASSIVAVYLYTIRFSVTRSHTALVVWRRITKAKATALVWRDNGGVTTVLRH